MIHETIRCPVDMHVHASCFWHPWLIQCCGSSFLYPNVSDAYNPQRSKTEQQQRTMVTDHAAWRNLRRQIVLAAQSHVQFGGEIKYFMKLFCIFPHHPSTVLSLVTSLNGFHGCLWVIGLSSWVFCFSKGEAYGSVSQALILYTAKGIKGFFAKLSSGRTGDFIIICLQHWKFAHLYHLDNCFLKLRVQCYRNKCGVFFSLKVAPKVFMCCWWGPLSSDESVFPSRASEARLDVCFVLPGKKSKRSGHESDFNVRLLDFPVCTKYN